MAQTPNSIFFNIPGRLKASYSWRDVLELEKGTPCTLQFFTKLKKPLPGEDFYQVVFVSGTQQFYIPVDLFADYFEPDITDKNQLWSMAYLQCYPDVFKGDKLTSIRHDQRLEADRYLSELQKNNLFYDDAAIEDYLQCMALELMPDKQLVDREINTPMVRLLKSAAPDMMMLGNDVLLVSTGMLAALDTEDELMALMVREMSHHLLEHALVTIRQNIARANRAAFWGAVIDGVVAVTEYALDEHYDYYQPGLLFATNDIVQSLVNENIANRMGLDYAPKMEEEADRHAISYLKMLGKPQDALASALHKVNDYYRRVNALKELSKYGKYGTLGKRLKNLKRPERQYVDRDYLKRMMSVVSFEAATQDYNKQYQNASLLAMKNINNNLACADDYLMVARSLMKTQNTSESNAECLLYLDKADMVSEVEDVNITKMRILLMLRENLTINAVDMIKKYQGQLDVMFRQPHTEEDAEWITAEHLWAENLLKRIYIK